MNIYLKDISTYKSIPMDHNNKSETYIFDITYDSNKTVILNKCFEKNDKVIKIIIVSIGKQNKNTYLIFCTHLCPQTYSKCWIFVLIYGFVLVKGRTLVYVCRCFARIVLFFSGSIEAEKSNE